MNKIDLAKADQDTQREPEEIDGMENAETDVAPETKVEQKPIKTSNRFIDFFLDNILELIAFVVERFL